MPTFIAYVLLNNIQNVKDTDLLNTVNVLVHCACEKDKSQI